MRIALFGATGPTGKYLIQEALASDHQVFVYGRNVSRIRLTDNNVTLVSGQIHDGAAVAKTWKVWMQSLAPLDQGSRARREL